MTTEQLEKGQDLQRKIRDLRNKIECIEDMKPPLIIEDSEDYHCTVTGAEVEAVKSLLIGIEQSKLDQLQKQFDEL